MTCLKNALISIIRLFLLYFILTSFFLFLYGAVVSALHALLQDPDCCKLHYTVRIALVFFTAG